MDYVLAIIWLNGLMKTRPWSELEDVMREYYMKRLMKWFEVLSNDERGLAVKLLESYTLIPWKGYEAEFLRCLFKLKELHVFKEPTIVVPLKGCSNDDEIKSGDTFPYPILSYLTPIFGSGSRDNYLGRRSVASLEPLPSNPCTILLVDDYIGSGETPRSVISELIANHPDREDRLIIMTLAIHMKGIATIEEFACQLGRPISIIYSKAQHKGIETNTLIQDKEKAYTVVDALESRLRVPAKFRRGFHGCEDLITLMRTPNNTLPMFWFESRKLKGKWIAPFARH